MLHPCRMLAPCAIFALAANLSVAAAAPLPIEPAAAAAPRLKFEQYRLPNGLQVILHEDHRLPRAAVNLWYHVGPVNERAGRTGFAHLFEHMMFQGSQHIPNGAHFQLLEGAGASINATTDFDRTNYFETLPSNQLELALWLESDRMGFLLGTLDEKKLANQRDVVRNERRQSVESRPYGLVQEAMFHQLFPEGHPYYGAVIGLHADIEAARLNDVREFFSQYYIPNNASLVVAGDIDVAKTKAMIGKYFGPIPAGPPVPKVEVRTPPITSERRATVTDQIELPRIYMAWLTAPIYTPGDAEADLLAEVLGGGKASRLYERLVYQQQIAQDVSARQMSLVLGSIFSIEVTAKPGVTLEQLKKAIDAELATLRTEGPTAAELQRAQNSAETRTVNGLESLQGVADRLNAYNHYLGNPGYLGSDLDRYRKATIGALRQVAQDKLTSNSRVVIYGVPGKKVIQDVPRTLEGEARTMAQNGTAARQSKQPKQSQQPQPSKQSQQSWRAAPPRPVQTSAAALPVPQRFELANGLTVLLLEQHELPVVTAQLFVLAGSEKNPVDAPGLADFTADMLDEGTERRSSLGIARDTAQIGASLDTSSTSDSASAVVYTLKKNVDAAFDLLADVTLHPVFAQKEIDRIRNSRLTELLQQRDDPNELSYQLFCEALYGPKHPYGYVGLGTRKSLEAISRDNLMKFWKAEYIPENAALAIGGDLSLGELRELAGKYFGSWTGKTTVGERPPVKSAEQRRILIVDKAAAPQTALRIGQVGVSRASPDFVPLMVMNADLGGTFSSRINMNLRQKNGYTYGAYSSFSFRRGPGPFSVVTSVRTDATAPAVRELFGELENIRTQRASAQELERSRSYVDRSLPGQFETTLKSAASAGEIFVYGLPLNYYATLSAKIRAVTAEDVQRVARKYLAPQTMTVVAVGDRSRIEPELKRLDLGPVDVRLPD